MIDKPSKLQPALVGGLILGLCSSIPFIDTGNCCCLWAIVGGLVAARMLISRSPVFPITSGEGAMVGFLTGLIGSGINLLISVPINLLRFGSNMQGAQLTIDNIGDPAVRAMATRILQQMQDHPAMFAILGWLVFAFLSTGVATLGGLLGVSFFEKRKGQPPPSSGEPPSSYGFPPSATPPAGPSAGSPPRPEGPLDDINAWGDPPPR